MKKPWHFYLVKTDPLRMRYNTVGDWQEPNRHDIMKIEVADMKNPDYNFLVLLHELIEGYLCVRRGITDKEVTAFDMSHLTLEEPGAHAQAPYYDEHMFAGMIESLVADQLGVSWKKYDKKTKTIMKGYK